MARLIKVTLLMMQLQNDVRMLQHRSPIPIATQPPVHIPIATPQARSPVSGLSACAGYNPDIPPSSCGSGPGDKKGRKLHRVPSSDPFSLTTPTGLDDPDDSSPSSSDDSGGGGGGPVRKWPRSRVAAFLS